LRRFELLVQPSYASRATVDEEGRREMCRRLYSPEAEERARCLDRIEWAAADAARHSRFQEIMARLDQGEITPDEAIQQLEELEGIQ
jgi:hypothetical protein